MPLLPGKSDAVVSKNIKEMHGGQMYQKVKRKFGAAKAHKVAVAAAMSKRRESMKGGK